MDVAEIKRFKTAYYHASQEVEDIVIRALCDTYEKITGKRVDDSLREDMWQAVRGKC
jgi:hypothetical protein